MQKKNKFEFSGSTARVWQGLSHPGLQKTDFLPVQADFEFVELVQFA